jgi:iron-sulfur cluster assembly accessory protein
MASPSTLCALCRRTARSTVSYLPRVTPSTARAYSRAAAAATTTPSPLFLDFLAPSALRHASRPLPASSRRPFLFAAVQKTSRRTLATDSDPSAAKPARPIHNPRTDDDGAPMVMSISPRASSRLHAIATGDKNPNLALRVSIESGGCHGFQYLMDLTDLGKEPPAEQDTVFEGAKGEKIVVDEPSLELLNGSTVDYTMELIGSQFKITGIPGATSSCGCGTSFDIKL